MSDLKSSIQHQFGTAASNYTTSNVHAKGEDLAKMLEFAQLTGEEIVLDAGSGAGHVSFTFAPHVQEVTALDLTDAMLEQVSQNAQQRGFSNIKTQQGDIEKIPFPDATFDRVVSRYCAHHFPNPQQAVNEIIRVLKPNGILVLSDVVGFDDPTSDTFLQTIELLRDPSHVRDYTKNQWLQFFRTSGVHAEIAFPFEIALEFQPWIQRINTPETLVKALEYLFTNAPSEMKSIFKIQPDLTFTIPCAVFAVRKPDAKAHKVL